jgi:hypothetical protein
MNHEQRILDMLEKILSGQEYASDMLHDIRKRLDRMEKRLDMIIQQRNGGKDLKPATVVHIVKGITDTWQSLN